MIPKLGIAKDAMASHELAVDRALTQLLTTAAQMSDWERAFVHRAHRRGLTTARHRMQLANLVRRHLKDRWLADDILGQPPLFRQE